MERYRKILLLSIKIGIGSSIAIYIAQALHLEYAVSAGTVTLLTLMTTKWETIRLSVSRFATLMLTFLMGWAIFSQTNHVWITYGVLLALIVFIAEWFGLRATISVNSVVAAHLVTNQDFSGAAMWNEFLLVLIGVVIAVLLNLFHANVTHKRQIVSNMRDTESKLQAILGELAAYLSGSEMHEGVWDDICALEEQIQGYLQSAYEYQDNTFRSHPEYYVFYFKMRYEQCRILHNLHDEVIRILSMPKQAHVISEYLFYLIDYVIERNSPDRQMERLDAIFASMRDEELPKTRDEFESRAMLYHILMDIQDFLLCKADFVNRLDKKQLQRYWQNHHADPGSPGRADGESGHEPAASTKTGS